MRFQLSMLLIIWMNKNLKSIIKILGDEKEAFQIAKNIVKHRNEKKISKTSDLVKIIKKSKKKIFKQN